MLAEASLERRKARKGSKIVKIKKKEFKKMLKEARGEAYNEGYDVGYEVGYQNGVEKAESLWKIVSDVLIEKIAELSGQKNKNGESQNVETNDKKESRLYMFSNALAEKLKNTVFKSAEGKTMPETYRADLYHAGAEKDNLHFGDVVITKSECCVLDIGFVLSVEPLTIMARYGQYSGYRPLYGGVEYCDWYKTGRNCSEETWERLTMCKGTDEICRALGIQYELEQRETLPEILAEASQKDETEKGEEE